MKNISKKELKYRSKIISLTSMKKRNQSVMDLYIKDTSLSYKHLYFYMMYWICTMLKILGFGYNHKLIKKCEKAGINKKNRYACS